MKLEEIAWTAGIAAVVVVVIFRFAPVRHALLGNPVPTT